MKYYFIRTQISCKEVEKFANFLNDLPASAPVTIFLYSDGGACEAGRMLLHLINSNAKRFTLIAATISSSAFYLFAYATCKRHLVGGAVGMFHYGRQSVMIDDRNKVINEEDKNDMQNNLEYYELESRQLAERIMNDAEQKKYFQGKDVYFTHKRMLEMFPEVTAV